MAIICYKSACFQKVSSVLEELWKCPVPSKKSKMRVFVVSITIPKEYLDN